MTTKQTLIALAVLLALFYIAWATASHAAQPPRASLQYRNDLIRTVRYVWGFNGPVAVHAAQIHQESGWRPGVCSPFACGLTQFTPSTANWIEEVYPRELANGDVFNAGWAMRAQARYNKHIYDFDVHPPTFTECDKWAFVLSSYNGGPGNMRRDRALTARLGGDSSRWWNHVENHSNRAAWAFTENRGYPRNILLRWHELYRNWGPGVTCKEWKMNL